MKLASLLLVTFGLFACAQKRSPEAPPPQASEPAPATEAVPPPSSPALEQDKAKEAPRGGGASDEMAPAGAAPTLHRRVGGEVTLGEAKVSGLDDGVAKRALEGKRDELRRCYEKELLASPSLKGDVDAKLSVEKDGQVKATASGIGNAALETCVAETFEKLELGRGRGQVTVRITFAPES